MASESTQEPEQTVEQQVPNETEQAPTQANSECGATGVNSQSSTNDDNAKFYQDLLIKLMGFGMALIVLICVAVLSSGENEIFSLEDPNEVAKEAAMLKGVPGSNDYKIEFNKVRSAAKNSRGNAKVYLCIITFGTIFWTIAIVKIWKRYNEASLTPALPLSWVIIYCAGLIITQIFLAYFLFDIDEHGLSKFVKLFLNSF